MEEKKTKEINLLDLLTLLFNWITKIVKTIANFTGKLLQLGVKHWVIFLSTLILCVAAGQYMARTSAQKYKAGGIAMIYGGDTYSVSEVCRQIKNSIAKNKSLSLSAKLAIPDSVTKNIVSIDNYNVIDYLKDGTPDKVDFKRTHSLTDTLNLVMKDRIYIEFVTKNVDQIKTTQDALLKYFNSNLDLQAQYLNEKNNLEDRIKMCDAEIRRLDSLAKVNYFKNTNQELSLSDNKLTVGEQKKQLFYEDMLRLQDIKSYTNQKLATFKQPVDFPSGIVINPTPINNRKTYAIRSLIIGSLLAFLLVFIFDNYKKIITYLKNDQKK